MFTKACIALGNYNNRSLYSVVCYDIRYHSRFWYSNLKLRLSVDIFVIPRAHDCYYAFRTQIKTTTLQRWRMPKKRITKRRKMT